MTSMQNLIQAPDAVRQMLVQWGLQPVALPRRPRAYAAGPGVFWLGRKDWERANPMLRPPLPLEQYQNVEKTIFLAHGLEPLQPLDNEVKPFDAHSWETPETIFEGNVNMIKRADAVVANLNDFRGTEPDSGTVYEVAYGYAHGVYPCGYLNAVGSYPERSREKKLHDRHIPHADPTGATFESFPKYPGNLMWAVTCRKYGVLLRTEVDMSAKHPQQVALEGLQACVQEVACRFYSGQFALRNLA